MEKETCVDITLRPAVEEDCRRIWEWRNEPGVRNASFNTEPIPYEQHQQWYQKTLLNPSRRLFIVTPEGENPIGYVRLDREDGEITINIGLAPPARGKGYGTKAIVSATELALTVLKGKRVVALIKEDNQISSVAFGKAGYVRVPSEETEKGVIKMVYPKERR